MKGSSREREVRRIFEEHGFDAAVLASWGGEDLEHLEQLMSEEEFQVLLDRLAETDEESSS